MFHTIFVLKRGGDAGSGKFAVKRVAQCEDVGCGKFALKRVAQSEQCLLVYLFVSFFCYSTIDPTQARYRFERFVQAIRMTE